MSNTKSANQNVFFADVIFEYWTSLLFYGFYLIIPKYIINQVCLRLGRENVSVRPAQVRLTTLTSLCLKVYLTANGRTWLKRFFHII